MLLDYPWPGNVRELKNVIERAILLNGHEVLYPEDLSTDRRVTDRRNAEGRGVIFLRPDEHVTVRIPAQGLDLEQLERRVVEEALIQARGNLSQAAQLIGLSRDTMRYRIKKFGLAKQKV